ncbi:MAG: ATPase domain-containing protein, partial [Candidatus Thermoplasmatota archaeon]
MPEEERAALSIELLRAVFRHNRELLQELQFKIGMSRFERTRPLVKRISLTEDFELVADLPPTEEALEALKAVLDAVQGFLEVFVGETEASQRLLAPGARFLEEHRDALSVHHLNDIFPFLATQGKGEDRAGEVRRLEEREQVLRIFEALYSRYLSTAREEQAAVYMHKLGACLRDVAQVQEVDGKISISIAEGVDARGAVRLLSHGLDAMVELAETYFGRPHAFEEAARLLKPVFQEFGEVPEALGINDYVLRGALASNIRFGVQPLDEMLRGGLERMTSTLLFGAAGWARDALAVQFVREGLEMGGSVLMVTTSIPVQGLEEILSSFGVRCRDAMKSGRLAIVDYNTCHWQSVHGVERHGMIFRSSTDLTNLGIAVGMALDALKGAGAKRAVLDLLSPASALFGAETMLDFSMMLKAKFERADVTGLFILGKGHSLREVRGLQGVFDSLLAIEEEDDATALRVLTLSKPVFGPSPLRMRFLEEGIVAQGSHGAPWIIQIEDRRERVASGTQGL